MHHVKCNFKNITQKDKDQFKNSGCILLVSVGQEAHESDRFEATVDLVNSSFKFCTVSLYDSLQRYTMALNSLHNENYFHNVATHEGDKWLERSAKYLNKLTILKEIYRWDRWLNHPNFLRQLDELETLIKNDPVYKAAFDTTIDKYLLRYCKNLSSLSNFNKGRARKLCFNYVLEECAVLCLWPELNVQFDIYPSLHNEAIEETRRRFILSNYPDLLHPITLRFRNAAQLKPQYFELLENEK